MARIINFEGQQISVPDDATDQEVSSILSARNAPVQPTTPGGVPVGPNGVPRVEMGAPAPAPVNNNADKGLLHNFAVGAQGVGAGVRDIVLAPFDLMAGAQNLVTGGINKVFGTEIPSAMPASQMAEKVTAPFSIPETEMSPKEKLAYNINRFGTQAAGTGAALATRAPALIEAAGSKPAGDMMNRTLDTLARPYTVAPAKTAVGDAVSGAGAGVAVNAAQDFLPEQPTTPMGQALKGIANFVAPIVGGLGASGVQGVVEGLGGLVRNLANRRTDVNVPVSPSGAPYTLADTERAARDLQSRTTGAPSVLAKDIRENAAELTNPTRPGEIPVEASQLPTTGSLSRDPGLVTAEEGARVRNRGEFVQRDQNVKEAGAQRVASLRDPEADQGAVAATAQQQRDARMQPVEDRVQQIESLDRRVAEARQQEGAQFAPDANSSARSRASTNLDRSIVDENYIPARAEKNRQFDEAPGRNDQLPADNVFAAIDRIRAQANDLAPGILPQDFMRRLDALRPRIVERDVESSVPVDAQTARVLQSDPTARIYENVNVGGPGTASGGDLADLRKFIGSAQEAAQRSGNFDLADNLAALKRSINQTLNDAPGYAEANANYTQFADRFRPERNDEMAKFTREIDRGGQSADGQLNRGATPPSQTADRFLSAPEKAAALQRVLADAPNAEAGQAAVRDFMRSDFATTALNADGTLNPARASAWARNNAAVLEQFPALRAEFDGIVQGAQRGQRLEGDTRAFLDQARRTRRATEAEVDRSAIGTLLREDPRDVAKKILNGGYGVERQLDEINTLVKSDPAAARGWKAAVSEVLTDKVTSTRKVGETAEVQFARLATEFKNNEALLAKIYSPEEMNTLRQGHKILEYFKEAEKRSTIGSQTADKGFSIPSWAQLVVRHFKGDLAGGGLIKRFKLLLEQLPTNRQSAEEIVHMSWFNPDVAAYLLERQVKNAEVPQYNINLRRLQAAANASRESGQ